VSIYLRKNGFSIIELVVVISVIGILATLATLSFNTMQRKANIERYTRELFTDLQTARSDSIFRKNMHSIAINSTATGYAFRRYSSVNEDREDGGMNSPLVGVPPQYGIVYSKSIPLVITLANGGSAADRIFQFDTGGFASSGLDHGTIRINPVETGAAIDCIIISESRTNLGQMVGGNCVHK
jgi:prepilin-type N-terminal cleavage/methylation domain-containing protein